MKTSKKFFALIMALVMCSMLAIPVFASDGSFPDYASHWYNSTDSSKKMTVYVKGNPNANKTGMTLGVNSFGSNTAVYYEVYNNSTGKLLTSTSKSSKYLWNISGKDQIVTTLPSCSMYRVVFTVTPMPDNTSGRVMVWTYKK